MKPLRAREWHFCVLGALMTHSPHQRPPASAEAAARRHRKRSSRFKARRALESCTQAWCAESTVPDGRPAQARPWATLVAHSPCHRSARFTGCCSSTYRHQGRPHKKTKPAELPIDAPVLGALESTTSESRQHEPGPLSANVPRINRSRQQETYSLKYFASPSLDFQRLL